MVVSAADERPHAPGPELRWSESWAFDFWSADGSVAGWCRMVSLPNLGTGWYHAFLVGLDRPLVAVVDLEVPVPDRSLEIRTTGLWATHICETPLDHWTIGLEAFGLGVDDPAELYGRQFGHRVPLGFDLEWEAEGTADDRTDPTLAYEQRSRVSGEILVGSEELEFDGHGRRERHWGIRTDWDRRWFRGHGRLGDGTSFSAAVVDGDLARAGGWVDGDVVDVLAASQSMAGPGLPAGARVRLGGELDVRFEALAVTPVEVVDPEGRSTRAPRALCRVTASGDRTGFGWAEWNEPQP